MRIHALIILMVGIFFSCTSSHRMINYELSYPYQPGTTTVNKRILDTTDSLKILLSFYNPNENKTLTKAEFIAKNKFLYKITYNHFSKENLKSDTIDLDAAKITISNKTYFVNFTIPKFKLSSYLLIIYKKDINRNSTEIIDIPVESVNLNLSHRYIFYTLTNTPILNNYILKGDTLIIKNMRKENKILYAYHYKHDFSPAIPPMDFLNDSEKKTLTIDTSYFIKINEPITLSLPGLYFIQEDTSTTEGFSFLVKDYKFPLLTKVEEMLEPLVYLMGENEKTKLENPSSPKAALDSFWLQIGGSKEYSRQIIKSFYQKVELTNKTFTSYKEGWKTDRGMIYIIFGKPDQIYATGDQEEWIYENILGDIVNFIFVKKPNIFSDNHYELIRNPSYDKYWYTTIERWKSGIITK